MRSIETRSCVGGLLFVDSVQHLLPVRSLAAVAHFLLSRLNAVQGSVGCLINCSTIFSQLLSNLLVVPLLPLPSLLLVLCYRPGVVGEDRRGILLWALKPLGFLRLLRLLGPLGLLRLRGTEELLGICIVGLFFPLSAQVGLTFLQRPPRLFSAICEWVVI